MSKAWTESNDIFLLTYGPAVGYDYVASHDLGKEDGEGIKRLRWLRRFRASLCARIESDNLAADAALDAAVWS